MHVGTSEAMKRPGGAWPLQPLGKFPPSHCN
jgi:hypothetical protein